MRVFTELNHLPSFRNSVVTIGSFDGVHLGHQKILAKLQKLAKEVDGESVVITFHPHPRHLLKIDSNNLKLLHSIREKKYWLEQFGVDNLVIIPFTQEFASQSPEEYIHQFLLKTFSPQKIVIGYDHKFGKNRSGNFELLKKEIPKGGPEVVEIEKEEINDLAISSTKVRNAITLGKMKLANNLLGHSYSLHGTVIKGEQMGTALGFPTANIQVDEEHKLIPSEGIYAVRVSCEEAEFIDQKGMLYIGTRPSLKHLNELSIEVNIFDFNEDLYGKKLLIHIEEFIRGDKKYDNAQDLQKAIQEDKYSVLAYFEAKKESSLQAPVLKGENSPEVAVVILNYNGKEHLEKYLPSILDTRYPNLRIIVVDNSSDDDSVEFLKKEFKNVELYILDKNYGFTGGYAKALSVIDSEFLVLLNSDVRVQSDWLEKAMEQIQNHPEVGVVQPKILSDKKPEYFEYAGAAGGWIDHWGYPFCRGRLFDTLEKDTGQYDQVQNIFWASGCAFLIRNKVYKKAGGLDPQFFAHLEEIDLCWRIQRMGYEIKFAPESVVYHLGGGTLSYQSPRKTRLNFRNSLIMVAKNKSGISLYLNIVLRLILDGIAGLKFLLSGKPQDCWAIISAHFSFYSKIGDIRKRKKFEARAILSNKLPGVSIIHGFYKKSVVADYFLKGKKYFSNLDV